MHWWLSAITWRSSLNFSEWINLLFSMKPRKHGFHGLQKQINSLKFLEKFRVYLSTFYQSTISQKFRNNLSAFYQSTISPKYRGNLSNFYQPQYLKKCYWKHSVGFLTVSKAYKEAWNNFGHNFSTWKKPFIGLMINMSNHMKPKISSKYNLPETLRNAFSSTNSFL